ncbi:helix-turn-helix domain-containing protein [Acidiphilium sp. JA12-A1]|uniref:HVO_A0114 family putative DNA-binding protein n=1 Tax=Acidiphilium sp. JA12-A1 TaxID=1464546 RepID=UPI000461791E|nr:helix-turn-helix domain-containing protein [Acidiphilium sp. JA12-A1]KDM65100.1 helix-turn-helix domain-containing protein [Acidiphilium sp. JA12-A1]
MSNTISASTMRDRLLARIQSPPKSHDWARVLGVPGHRELLGLIARHNPPSIGALAELAGRAQPNVSRTLSALHSAGLIEVVSIGRRSIPRITETGAAKAREFGLLESGEEPSAPAIETTSLFTVEIDQTQLDENAASDVMKGRLTIWLWLSSSREKVAAQTSGNLDALGCRLLENWWRVLYRRDAPFRLWDFALDGQAGTSYALLATVLGARVNLQARGDNERMLDLEHGSKIFSVPAFEQLLLDEFLRPLATYHWLKGRSTRPLHALLQRIEDSRGQSAERAFCRTAGALGMTPYDLDDDRAAQIRDLLELIPEEDARLDFSSAVLADALGEGQLWTSRQLELFRQRNAMPILTQLRANCIREENVSARPYRHGYALARSARAILKLVEDRPVGGVEGLSKLLGAADTIGLSPEAPGALRAFQNVENDVPTIIVEDEGPRASAFVLARGVGDFIAFGNRSSCVADLYTDRQAVGRAFAAEFMAPRAAVVRMIEEEGQPVAQIADHFGVQAEVVHRQYENSFSRS